jgi:hypothetical protein
MFANRREYFHQLLVSHFLMVPEHRAHRRRHRLFYFLAKVAPDLPQNS